MDGQKRSLVFFCAYIQVAKAESNDENFEELRRFSSLYPHPNVLPFLAMCTRFYHVDFVNKLADEAIMVPYYEFGSLRAFVQKYRTLLIAVFVDS